MGGQSSRIDAAVIVAASFPTVVSFTLARSRYCRRIPVRARPLWLGQCRVARFSQDDVYTFRQDVKRFDASAAVSSRPVIGRIEMTQA
jgi:hypothetical protein